jgi:hypothetical protein
MFQGGDNGPETITLTDFPPGMTYMLYVMDFNPNANIALWASGGQIKMYENGPIDPIFVPTSVDTKNRYWLVGCFKSEGGLSSFNNINTLLPSVPNPLQCS